MNVPEEMRIDTNIAVVFKKSIKLSGDKFDAIAQGDDGTIMFFSTEYMLTDGKVKVVCPVYKDVDGGLKNE